jgi:hypothetical protein
VEFVVGLLLNVGAFLLLAFGFGAVVMIFGNDVLPNLSYLQWVSVTIAGYFIVMFANLMEDLGEATRPNRGR